MENISDKLKGIVLRYEKGSLEDGDGMRTVIYMKGCPLHCWWCSTPESHRLSPELAYSAVRCVGCGKCIVECSEKALRFDDEHKIIRDKSSCTECFHCVETCPYSAHKIYGEEKTVQEVLDIVTQDAVNYFFTGGGVTFSGGECLMQADFVAEVMKESHRIGINTCMETTVAYPWEQVEKVLPYVDVMYIDLKVMDEELHKKYVGGDVRRIMDNIRKIDESDYDIRIRLRVPTMLSVNGNRENMEALARFYKELKKAEYVELLPYHRLGLIKYEETAREYKLPDEETPTDAAMKELAETIVGVAHRPVLVSGIWYGKE